MRAGWLARPQRRPDDFPRNRNRNPLDRGHPQQLEHPVSAFHDNRWDAVEVDNGPLSEFWADAEAEACREAYDDAVDALEEHASADGYPTVESWLDGEGVDHAVSCVGYDALAMVFPCRAEIFIAA